MAALLEFVMLAVLGAIVGSLGHFWRARSDVYPLMFRPGSPLNLPDPDHDTADLVLGTEYDEAGYYEKHSTRNWLIAVISLEAAIVYFGFIDPWTSPLRHGVICDSFSALRLTPFTCR